MPRGISPWDLAAESGNEPTNENAAEPIGASAALCEVRKNPEAERANPRTRATEHGDTGAPPCSTAFNDNPIGSPSSALPLVAAAAAAVVTTTTAAATTTVAAAAVATPAAATTTAAVAAAATAAAATTVAAATTAAATVATTATTAAAAEAAATTAAAEATAAAFLTRLRLVDAQRTTIEVGAVHRLDRGLRVRVVRHLDEREAARATRVTIEHDLDLGHLTAIGAECRTQDVLGGLKGEVANVQSRTHRSDDLFSLLRTGSSRGPKGASPEKRTNWDSESLRRSPIDRQNG